MPLRFDEFFRAVAAHLTVFFVFAFLFSFFRSSYFATFDPFTFSFMTPSTQLLSAHEKKKMKNKLVLLSLLVVISFSIMSSTDAFHPRVMKRMLPPALHVSSSNGDNSILPTTTIPSSFDPHAFDAFDENWSISFNNPYVMAAYGRYLETGQMDPYLERVLVARQRRLEQQLQQHSQDTTDASNILTHDDDYRRQLWMEGEQRRQQDLERRMKEPKKPASTRWVQGPRKPEPPLSDPRNAIFQTPRVPPSIPPNTRAY